MPARKRPGVGAPLRVWCTVGIAFASQGQSERGRALLEPVFKQFTEGSDAADLKAAERMLAILD
jgi:hypothetical protein